MIVFPNGFVKTKYPGYFWNIETQSLYSIKIGGELRKLTLKHAWYDHASGRQIPPGYRVSVKGVYRLLTLTYLTALVYPKSTEQVDVAA
jgi:hypothetical protein